MPVPDLDAWLADPAVRTRHRRAAPVDASALWTAAGTVRLRECRVLGRLIRARIPGLAPDLSFDELFAGAPFTVLDEGPTHRLSALCGRIWTVRGGVTVLADPSDFLTWGEPGTVRVLFANWAEPSEGGATLVSEVRVGAVDGRARLLPGAPAPRRAGAVHRGVSGARRHRAADPRRPARRHSRAVTSPAASRTSAT